ncbi:ThuA domain-containing protein [Candidatus Latescibacterota bacterium]
MKVGITTIGASSLAIPEANAFSKSPGDIVVMAIGGDYYHNPLQLEYHFREIFGPTNWRLIWAQSAQFITPEILSKVDLFVLMQGVDPDDFGFSTDGLVEHRAMPYPFMAPVVEDAFVENVNRGMGLICLHGSLRFPNRTKFIKMVGIKEEAPHGGQVNHELIDFNQEHPITQGITRLRVSNDQMIAPELEDPNVVELFRAKRDRGDESVHPSGWCLDRGKGRIVVFLPGHSTSPWGSSDYKQMVWRAGHWALKMDIPEQEFRRGIPAKPRNFMYNADSVTEIEE